MMVPRLVPATFALICSVLLMISSIVCLAFKSTSFTSYMERTDSGQVMTIAPWSNRPSSDPTVNNDFIAIYPEYLFPVVQSPIIVTTSFNLVFGLAVTGTVAWSLKKKRTLRISFSQYRCALIALSINLFISTGVLVYTQVQFLRSSNFDPNYVSNFVAYDKGQFSLEKWTCETPKYVDGFQGEDLDTQCQGEKASRGLMVVVWLCSLAIMLFLMWDFRAEDKQVVALLKRKKIGEIDPYFGDEEDMY